MDVQVCSLHYRAPRTGRNPKTGDSVTLSGKYVPHFKPSKDLRDRPIIASSSLILSALFYSLLINVKKITILAHPETLPLRLGSARHWPQYYRPSAPDHPAVIHPRNDWVW